MGNMGFLGSMGFYVLYGQYGVLWEKGADVFSEMLELAYHR